jgi:hypothetical protein
MSRETRPKRPTARPIPIPASAPAERPVLWVELEGEEAEVAVTVAAAAAAVFWSVEVVEVLKDEDREVLSEAI